MATINEIKQQAAAVKNATQVGENTAERVGSALAGLAEIAKEQEDNIRKKADKAYTDVELNKKANAADVDTKFTAEAARVNAELDKKANDEVVKQSFLEQTVKNAAQDAEISKKANSADVTSQMQTEQNRVNTELEKKFDKSSIAQVSGKEEDKVMSQKAVSDKLSYLNCLNIHKYINNNAPISFEDAIKSVQLKDRKCSMEIAFRDSYNNVIFALYPANDVGDEHFLNTKNWIIYNRPDFLSYRGAITEGEIWKNKSNGYYSIKADSLSNITDAPQGLGVSAVVQVFSSLNDVNGIQILTSSKGEVWSRAFPKADAAENTNQWMVIHSVSSKAVPKTRWFALGDSITEGYYSENGELKGVTNLNYPYYVGIINDYETHNYGVGGSGYVHNATVGDHKNAKDKVDTIDFANCDLTTLAWGVNDWHYNCQIGKLGTSTKGDGTMVGNMIYVIEKILNDNPSCKIVVILPSNSSKYGGNKETNWGLGSSLQTSGTLQNIIDKQKEVCEYYGIQFIDQTKNGIINRENIQSLLPDGLHPAKDGYLQIARFLSKQICF